MGRTGGRIAHRSRTGSAVAPAASLETAAAGAAMRVTGVVIPEPVPESSLVAWLLAPGRVLGIF